MDNMIVGFAIGFNINISVDVQPIYAMGTYGPAALEPTYYNMVTGTLQIIRLSRPNARNKIIAQANAQNIDGQGTNGSKAIGMNGKDVNTVENETVTAVGNSNIYTHIDPDQVLISSLFDISVQLRIQKVAATTFGSVSENKNIIMDAENNTEMVNWMFIRGCRISSRSTNITMGQIVNEPVSFTGLFVTPAALTSGDLFTADSGIQDN